MSSTAKLGAFMLATLIIVGFFILRIERISLNRQKEGQKVQAAFPTVAGLDERAPVRIAGVRVGVVEKIRLTDDHALVSLAIDRSIKLHQGAKAAVRMLGMLGDQYVELYPGPAGAPALPAGTILQGTSPAGFDKVLDTAGGVGSDIKEVTASLRATLGGPEGQRKIDEILANVRELTASLKTMSEENRAQIAATISNFREFSESLKTELPKLADKLGRLADNVDAVVEDNRESVSDALHNVRDLTAQLRASADNLNQITGKIARGEGSIGKLINDTETVDNLNSTLKSVESGVSTLKNTVGRVERWRLDADLRAESLPKINDSRTTFGFDLHTTDQRFYRAGVVRSPVGRTKTSTEVITTTDQDGTTSTITRKVVRNTDDFTFNLQIGYQMDRTTLRAGLFEDTGGVGLDQWLFKNKAALTLEAYDFNRDEKAPHLRLEGRYFLTRNLYFFTGVDDPRWSQNRSVLIGAGVTWTDQDIKYLLGSAASAVRP